MMDPEVEKSYKVIVQPSTSSSWHIVVHLDANSDDQGGVSGETKQRQCQQKLADTSEDIVKLGHTTSPRAESKFITCDADQHDLNDPTLGITTKSLCADASPGHEEIQDSSETGKPVRVGREQSTKCEKIFHVSVKCSRCATNHFTRTRTGAPYTNHFLKDGVTIKCSSCEEISKSPCLPVNIEDVSKCASIETLLIVCCHPGCKSTFARLGAYGQHKLRHADDPVPCPECGQTFQNKSKLASHSDAVHRDKSLDKVCDQCGKPFKNENELRRHVKACHTAKEVIQCEVCDKVVQSRYGLRVHMSVHQTKEYLCPVCAKVFQSRAGYNGHYKTHVTDNTCKVCQNSFSTVDGLAKHHIVHKSDRNTFFCILCNKSYISKVGIVKHLEQHSRLGHIAETDYNVNDYMCVGVKIDNHETT